MAGTPTWKVYRENEYMTWKVYRENEYMAACKYPEDAAVLVSAMGEGATIRHGHSKKDTVWTEGSETFSAGESYDGVAEIAWRRLRNQRVNAAVIARRGH